MAGLGAGSAALLALRPNRGSGPAAAGVTGRDRVSRATTVRANARPAVPRRRGPKVTSVPILMYHVINTPPPHAPFPGLYLAAPEFARQMAALAAAGYRGVTLDEVVRNWTKGAALPEGRPIVISFDNGYRSQYTNALPVLRREGWPAVLNLQLSGLPPAQGGLAARQVRALVRAGWELDTQGFSHADLPTLSRAQLRHEVLGSRRLIRARFRVAVNWFCYPSGDYDGRVIAAVKAAGYRGATTVVPGWATTTGDPYRLPRLRVLGSTSPSALLALIQGSRDSLPAPAAYG